MPRAALFSIFSRELKRLLDEGAIGQLVDIQHIESVGYWHMAHSFVRGNWRNKSLSSPMILQKCCHDMDILLWLVGASCTRLTSFGNLMHLKKKMHQKMLRLTVWTDVYIGMNVRTFAPRFYLEGFRGKKAEHLQKW